jgi:hypothetical protein
MRVSGVGRVWELSWFGVQQASVVAHAMHGRVATPSRPCPAHRCKPGHGGLDCSPCTPVRVAAHALAVCKLRLITHRFRVHCSNATLCCVCTARDDNGHAGLLFRGRQGRCVQGLLCNRRLHHSAQDCCDIGSVLCVSLRVALLARQHLAAGCARRDTCTRARAHTHCLQVPARVRHGS